MSREKDIEREIREEQEEKQAVKRPQSKKRKAANALSTVLLVVGIVLVGVAGWNLFQIFRDYSQSDKLYGGLQSDYVSVRTDFPEAQKQETPWYQLASVDLAGVKRLNADTVGWLYFENEEISYPVMYSGDNTSYLRTSFDGLYATAGAIFMEGANNPDFQDSHTIIYGHNMKNLSMFGRLKYYNNEGYYKDHMYFQIFTDEMIYRYQIFAYADISEDSSVYQVPFSDSPEFGQFIEKLYSASFEETGVIATQSDKIITLSTCSTDKRRFVVHAVRVDSHPNPGVEE